MPIHHGRLRENFKSKKGLLNAEERIYVARKRAKERDPRKPRRRR